ncbi:MAG: hypothetical protein JEY94_06115 [Melioribacteraceae bacterium]|nr:hypothetical protein [Melioribacteraceae bacterium]
MLIKLGNWVFHYRNFLFIFFYATLFIPAPQVINNSSTALIIGAIIIFLGMIIRAGTIGFVYIVRGGKNRKIHAEKLVTEGVYSVCRNPMYLGNILLILGFAFFTNSLFFLVVMFPLFCLFYIAIISAEENFLISKFPVEYPEYKKDSNALFPKLSKLCSFHKGYKFNFIRVIKKEYGSTFLYVSGMLLSLLFQSFITAIQFAIYFLIALVLYLIIRVLKKKKKLVE